MTEANTCILDTTVRCQTCGAERRVNFTICLREGWPKCHGQTMALMCYPDASGIAGAVGEAIGQPVKMIRSRMVPRG